MPDVPEVLIEKGTAEAMSGIGQQGIDGASRRGGPQSINAVRRREIRFDHGDVGAKTTEAIRGLVNFRSIGRGQQVEAVFRAQGRQLESNARRRACHDCEWFAHGFPSSNMSTGTART